MNHDNLNFETGRAQLRVVQKKKKLLDFCYLYPKVQGEKDLDCSQTIGTLIISIEVKVVIFRTQPLWRLHEYANKCFGRVSMN